MRKRVIVSSADAGYFPLLQSLIRSIRDKPAAEQVDIAVLDVGLDNAQVAWLDENSVISLKPGATLIEGLSERLKAFSSRPLLPECVPGYDLYLWIDADAWVQDWAAVELYYDTAESGALALVASIDRGYDELIPSLRLHSALGSVAYVRGWTFDRLRRSYGTRAAFRLALTPTLNAGIFALRAGAPHWEEWASCYRQGRRNRTAGFDQVSLTYAIYERGLEVAYLPAWCNWVCSRGLPKVDPESGLLVEPHPPHHRLGLVHLMHRRSNPVAELGLVGGNTVRRALTYPGIG